MSLFINNNINEQKKYFKNSILQVSLSGNLRENEYYWACFEEQI